jgi:hypothetical protein
MRLTYVLDRPELCGGVKVVLGHRVTVLAAGERPSWIPFDGDFVATPSGPASRIAVALTAAVEWAARASRDDRVHAGT